MTDSECEIEYLDEDADIVQQLVQYQPLETAPEPEEVRKTPLLVERPAKRKITPESTVGEVEERRSKRKTAPEPTVEDGKSPLLVERPRRRKKRATHKRTEESDDDYDPNEDLMVPSPPSPSPKTKKKKQNTIRKTPKTEKDLLALYTSYAKKLNYKTVMSINQVLSGNQQYAIMKKLNIKIPDFDDPLCLPVKALDTDTGDKKRLQTWNNVCLEHFKHCDKILRPEKGETRSSSRTMVLRNVLNKKAGRRETTIWSKTCVINEDGDKKSEIFQCFLPNFKEMKTLIINNMPNKKAKVSNTTVDEVVLRKEENKDGDTLVVYKPKSGISSVFTMIDKRKAEDEEEETKPAEDKPSDQNEEVKRYLKEVTCSRMCVRCFQESWRGLKKIKGPIVCPICGRSFVTVYSLLTHIKAHSSADVQRYKRVISLALSEIVGYHYKCRMCREKCTSIKDMRKHVITHRGKDSFTCNICTHFTS